MNVHAPSAAVRQLKRQWQDRLCRPGIRRGLRTLGLFVLSFFLAGASAGGSFLPLSVALTASLDLGLGLFAAYLGGSLGYVRFWGMTTAMFPLAAGLLVVASSCVFDHISVSARRWFGPFRAMLFTALVGFLFLVEQAFVPYALWRWLLEVGVAGGGAHVFRKALEEDSPLDRLFLSVGLCWGLCALSLPGGLPLGAVAASALSAASLMTPLSLAAGAMCGLAVELSWTGGSAAVMVLTVLICRRWEQPVLRLSLWCVCSLIGVLLTGSGPLLLVAMVLGAPLSLLIPGRQLLGAPPVPEADGRKRLELTSRLLLQMSQCLDKPLPAGPEPELAVIFDRVAEKVCRLCPMWKSCWREEAETTLQALTQASGPMIARGALLPEDLPVSFLGQCREKDAFLTAVNRELEELRGRLQCRTRLRESRQVLSGQYRTLSLALTEHAPSPGLIKYRPEVGVRGQGRRGSSLSGDRGADFAVGKWYYVLLCDGMGAGEGASGESMIAVGLLEQMLRTGLEPMEALSLLNGVYLLRDDGGFATVDLLRADLVTGEAVLYKWGAAPSFLKRRGLVEQIGSAGPPPGLGLSETCRPEERQLSLARGELLVLTTDGLDPEETQSCLRQETARSVRDMAAAIVQAGGQDAADDRTAVVFTLRSRTGR